MSNFLKVDISYIEIYNEEIRDLLADNPDKKLDIKGNEAQGIPGT